MMRYLNPSKFYIEEHDSDIIQQFVGAVFCRLVKFHLLNALFMPNGLAK